MAPLNVLTATATDLQTLYQDGNLTTVEAAELYMQHILNHNHRFNALVEVTPQEHVLALATQLDQERAEGVVRGPLHGVPIVVKDNIATHPDLGLRTTGGSGSGMPCGWSPRGGQTQSPYVHGGWDPTEKFGGHSGPGGSSSGSATSVALGFALVSIGTKTWGSLIMPASRANVFTLKGTRGIVQMQGVMPVNDILDIVGPLARGALDIANIFDVMLDPGYPFRPADGYASKATGSWEGLRLGAVRTADWRIDEILADPDEDWFAQQEHDIVAAYDKLKDLGVSIKHPIPFAKRGPLANVLGDVINHNFVRCFDEFLSDMESSSVRSVKQLVEWNRDHAELEMPSGKLFHPIAVVSNTNSGLKRVCPNQDTLLGALETDAWSTEATEVRLKEGEHHAAAEGIDRFLKESDVDIILGPADCWLTDFACVAAMLPLSFWKKNGRAFGIIAITSKNREDLLIQLMSAWETVFPLKFPLKL
ncbi:Amidase [Ilyonectria robusta]